MVVQILSGIHREQFFCLLKEKTLTGFELRTLWKTFFPSTYSTKWTISPFKEDLNNQATSIQSLENYRKRIENKKKCFLTMVVLNAEQLKEYNTAMWVIALFLVNCIYYFIPLLSFLRGWFLSLSLSLSLSLFQFCFPW